MGVDGARGSGGLSFIITEEESLGATAANRHMAFPPHAEFTL